MGLKKSGKSQLDRLLKAEPEVYRKMVADAAVAADGNVRRMAWILGHCRQSLYRVLNKHRLWGPINAARAAARDKRIVERRG